MAWMTKLPPEITLSRLASVLVVLTLNTLAVPTKIPLLLLTRKIPDMVVLAAVELTKPELGIPLRNSALFAVPAKIALLAAVNVMPG